MSGEGHDPRAVVNGMIAYARARRVPLWNVSIQKLLYFAHASFLVRHKQPLIRGYFEAWEYGPVCRPVYDALKGYGRNQVTELLSRADPFSGKRSMIEPPSELAAQDQIAEIIRTMGYLTPHQLISLSHVREGAWWLVWNKAQTHATLGNRIDDSLIVERFAKLKVALVRHSGMGDTVEDRPITGD